MSPFSSDAPIFSEIFCSGRKGCLVPRLQNNTWPRGHSGGRLARHSKILSVFLRVPRLPCLSNYGAYAIIVTAEWIVLSSLFPAATAAALAGRGSL